MQKYWLWRSLKMLLCVLYSANHDNSCWNFCKYIIKNMSLYSSVMEMVFARYKNTTMCFTICLYGRKKPFFCSCSLLHERLLFFAVYILFHTAVHAFLQGTLLFANAFHVCRFEKTCGQKNVAHLRIHIVTQLWQPKRLVQ